MSKVRVVLRDGDEKIYLDADAEQDETAWLRVYCTETVAITRKKWMGFLGENLGTIDQRRQIAGFNLADIAYWECIEDDSSTQNT